MKRERKEKSQLVFLCNCVLHKIHCIVLKIFENVNLIEFRKWIKYLSSQKIFHGKFMQGNFANLVVFQHPKRTNIAEKQFVT